MIRHIVFVAFFLFHWSSLSAQNIVHHEGSDYFINGINAPWNHFGADIGSHDEWGSLFDESYFDTFLKECQAQGVNCARWWIHCDGRANPEFNVDGSVTGLDENFIDQFNAVNNLALSYNVMLMPCLWSFDMLKDYTSGAGVWAGLHHDLVEDDDKTKSYINNALIPFLSGIEQTCNILAIDIINEPEWGMKGSRGAGVDAAVSKDDMQRFVGRIAAAIHENSDIKTTLGSTSLNYVSEVDPAKKPLWSDYSLQSAAANDKAFLDFYQIHYYDWMFWKGWNPFLLNYEYWELDKPCIIGEYPAMNGIYKPEQMVQLSFSKKWGGHMPWSYSANDGHGNWEAVKNAIQELTENHEEQMKSRACKLTANVDDFYVTLVDENSVRIDWVVEESENVKTTELYRSADSSMQSPVLLSNFITVTPGDHNSIDIKPFPGDNYYQLKKIRNDESFFYTAIKSVFVLAQDDKLFTIVPNPAQQSVTINYFQVIDLVGRLEIFDLFGKKILDQNLDLNRGNNIISIDASNFPNGTYYLRINNDLKPFAKVSF